MAFVVAVVLERLKTNQLYTEVFEVLSVQGHDLQVVHGRRRGDQDIAYIQVVTSEFGSGEEFATLIGDMLINRKNAS